MDLSKAPLVGRANDVKRREPVTFDLVFHQCADVDVVEQHQPAPLPVRMADSILRYRPAHARCDERRE
jgi:hypothetical protein